VDQGWAAGVDLLTQVADVRLEHARIATEVITPDVIEKLPARDTRRGFSIK